MTSSNVLLSSAGRRVGLIACLRDSLRRRGQKAIVYCIDHGATAPATYISDAASRVPRCTDPCFLDHVLNICRDHRIELVIPTIDTELPTYSNAATRFAAAGVTVCISSSEVVEICSNKQATHEWLVRNGFPTVRQTNPMSALNDRENWPLPLIAKPRRGSASIGVHVLKTVREMESVAEFGGNIVIEEIAPGREFTINVYLNRKGRCVCAVPHWRMEVRSGEVSKGITVKDRRLIDLAQSVAEALPGAYGPLNIQCFMDDADSIRIIELNARFGGGYPLTHKAGARFTDWLFDELEGKCPGYCDDWVDDLAMLRFDDAIYLKGDTIRQWAEGSALSSTSTIRSI